MTESREKPKPDDLVRILRLITGALMLGVLLYAAVAVNLHGLTLAVPQDLGVLTLAGLAAGAGAFVMQRAVFQVLRGQSIKWIAETDPLRLDDVPGALQTRTIVALALLEGAAFINVTAYMQEQNPLSFAAAVVLLFAMACYFPTYAGVHEAIADDERRIEEERSRK